MPLFVNSVLVLVLFASLTQGIFQATGLPLAIPKTIVELGSWLIFSYALLLCHKKNTKFNFIWLLTTPLLAIYLTGLISTLITDTTSTTSLFLLFRSTFSLYPLFLGLINLEIKSDCLRRCCSTIIFLFFAQLPFIIYKFATIGVDENIWIGALHQNAGQISVLFPLFLISIISPWFLLYGRDLKHVIIFTTLIMILTFFAIVGEKRATIFLVPLWLYLCFSLLFLKEFLNNKQIFAAPKARALLIFFILSLGVFYGSQKFIPSLNLDEKVGGEISIFHVFKYTRQYLTRDYVDPLNNPIEKIDQDKGIQLGRLAVIERSFSYISSQNIVHFLFGFGASAMNPSYLLGPNRSDVAYQNFGIRGAASNAVRVLFESGTVGVLLKFFWFTAVFIWLLNTFLNKSNKTLTFVFFSALTSHCVFFFDFLLYSDATWCFDILSPLYFLLLALAFRANFYMNDRIVLKNFLKTHLKIY